MRALDGVDLAVDRGELLAVCGASGSGKTTLLNLLAGLDMPTAGSIAVGGRRLESMARHELAAHRARCAGVVFQAFNLLPHQTALANVELGLTLAGWPRARRRDAAAAALAELGLADRLHHRPLDLSGGEQQRVALARALAKDPQLLLADEPTGNLDEASAAVVAGILGERRRRGLTVVVVTHDRGLARRVADRVVRLHYGRVVPDEAVTT